MVKKLEARENVMKETDTEKNSVVDVKNASISTSYTRQVSIKPAEPVISAEEINKKKEASKNNFILITGATLIILAAIVFLTSTWDVIGNIVKIVSLGAFAFVFLGMSKIAKDKFNLGNTANTFFYIAMAYIPILALATYWIILDAGYIITSQQHNIFWLIACLVMAAIYGGISFKGNKRILFIFSLIMQVFSVIFGTLIFTDVFDEIMLVTICAYNLILTCIIAYLKPKIYGGIIQKLNTGIFVISLIINVFELLNVVLAYSILPIVLVTAINLIISVIYARKQNSIAYITSMVVNTFALIFGIAKLKQLDISQLGMELTMLVTTIGLLCVGMFSKWEKLKVVTQYTTYAFLLVTYRYSVMCGLLHTHAIIYLASAISILFMNMEKTSKQVFLNIAIILFVIGNGELSVQISNLEISNYIMLITSAVLYAISLFVNKENIKTLRIHSNIVMIFSMLSLSVDISIIKLIINLATTILFCVSCKKLGAHQYINAIPLIVLLPSIYMNSSSILLQCDVNILSILSIILIFVLTLLSIKDRKVNVYTIVSYIYFFMQVAFLDINKYVDIIILMIVSILQVLSYKDSEKAFLKIISYISILVLYNTIVGDIGTELMTVKLLGYVLILGLLTRTTFTRISEDLCKVAEYFGYAILYIVAVLNCTSSLDVMLFMTLLILSIMFTYMKKFGPIFLCSIIAELIFAYKVTKEFWESIPWWIYLLVGGVTLIAFAVKNELKAKEGKATLKETVKKISDKLKF